MARRSPSGGAIAVRARTPARAINRRPFVLFLERVANMLSSWLGCSGASPLAAGSCLGQQPFDGAARAGLRLGIAHQAALVVVAQHQRIGVEGELIAV